VEILHVPYRGTAPALTDLIANVCDMMFDVVPEFPPRFFLEFGLLFPQALHLLPMFSVLRERSVDDTFILKPVGEKLFQHVLKSGIRTARSQFDENIVIRRVHRERSPSRFASSTQEPERYSMARTLPSAAERSFMQKSSTRSSV
jgi:hypothetical protein